MPIPKTLKDREALAQEITTMLKVGETVIIPGLGNFSVINKAARTARNPRTGDAVQVPAKKAVKHSVSGALKTALNS